jgi:hypothetical protein
LLHLSSRIPLVKTYSSKSCCYTCSWPQHCNNLCSDASNGCVPPVHLITSAVALSQRRWRLLSPRGFPYVPLCL